MGGTGGPTEGIAACSPPGLAVWQRRGQASRSRITCAASPTRTCPPGTSRRASPPWAEALAVAEGNDERNYMPELLRLRGALLASDPATSHEAEAAFEQAVSLACQQRSRVLARRAAASFATHLSERGRSAEAQRRLAELDRALAGDTVT
jgi:hypothetical protein